MGVLRRNTYSSYTEQKERATAIVDELNALLLGICPILQHYQGIFMELGSEVLILMLPLTALRLLVKRKLYFQPILPCILYALYVATAHGLALHSLAREAILLAYYAAVLNGCVDIGRLFRITKIIALFAFACMLIQYLCYYLLGFHLQLVPTGLLLDNAQQWVRLAQTGVISVTGSRMAFYRPSAFFLEPSHLSIYCIPVLTILLTSNRFGKREIQQAVLITLSILLSTSGLGIAFAAAAWLMYGAVYYGADDQGRRARVRELLRTRSVVFLLFFVLLFVVLYASVGVFRSSVNRVLFGNAIDARTATGIRLLQMLSGTSLLFGRGTSYQISSWNISGFFYTVFQYGIVGLVLSYLLYFNTLRKKVRREYRLLAFFIILLSFFTVHTFAAYYRLYLVSFVLCGYRIRYCEGDQGQKAVGNLRSRVWKT